MGPPRGPWVASSHAVRPSTSSVALLVLAAGCSFPGAEASCDFGPAARDFTDRWRHSMRLDDETWGGPGVVTWAHPEELLAARGGTRPRLVGPVGSRHEVPTRAPVVGS